MEAYLYRSDITNGAGAGSKESEDASQVNINSADSPTEQADLDAAHILVRIAMHEILITANCINMHSFKSHIAPFNAAKTKHPNVAAHLDSERRLKDVGSRR